MKRILFALLATCSFSLFADTWTDPETGITWTYQISAGSATIKNGYSSAIPTTTAGHLTIPATLGGCPVVHIGSCAFEYCEYLTSVVMPPTIESVGACAFGGCYKITSITLSAGLKNIEESAFGNCKELVSVTIPNGVVEIAKEAFRGCVKLETLVVPSTVTAIGARAFSECAGLVSVTLSEGVKTIGEGAFSHCGSIKFFVLPSGIESFGTESVGNSAFSRTYVDKFYCDSAPRGWSSTAFDDYSIGEFYCLPEHRVAWTAYFARAGVSPIRFMQATPYTVEVIPSIANAGTLSFRNKDVPWGETVEVTATPKEGYVFLGWGSNVEGIEGVGQTLTFTMPERPVTLVASFFPKALLETWFNEAVRTTVKEEVEAKIDGESLLTSEQAATKTSATIEAKVEKGELITSDQLQVMAMEAPVIAVEDGVAKVGVSLKRAESLNGEWTQVEAEEAEITEDGDISVSVPADEKAAFYKFVVPNQQ